MKILVFNVNAYSASTGRIVEGLYKHLSKEGHTVKVCYRGTLEKKIDNSDFIALCSKLGFTIAVFFARLTGLESHFSFRSTYKAKRIIRNYKPDIIQLYNLHGNYINSYDLLSYIKKIGIPAVYSMVDENPYMGRCPYPVECEKFKSECNHCPRLKEYPISWFFDTSRFLFRKKSRIYAGFPNIIFTGPPYVCERASQSYLLRNQRVLPLDEPFNFNDYYYPRDTKELRTKLNIQDDNRVVVCASGTLPRKGGKFFMDVARLLKDDEKIRFVFIGYDRNDWEIPTNVITIGFISDQNVLADYMSLADAYVCTSVGDTTPSVCLGALGCGTPIIGFDYGGVVDCAPNEFGTYVPIGDLNAMAKAIKGIKKKKQVDIERIRQYALERFSSEQIYKRQEEIYKDLIETKN